MMRNLTSKNTWKVITTTDDITYLGDLYHHSSLHLYQKLPQCFLIMSNLQDFYDYVLSFYGAGGLYPMNATLDLIEQATLTHLKILELKGNEFCGDSIDRECVRDLLISKYKLSH